MPFYSIDTFMSGKKDTIEDDSLSVIIGGDEEVTIEPIPPSLPAQLVNREEEERRAKQEVIRNAGVADVVPKVALDNSGRRWKFAGAFLVLILIVVGVVLAVTLPDPSLFPETLRDLLSSVSSDKGEALSTNSTPQSKAFNWMVANNATLGTFSEEIIIQRYALATLFYSTNGDSWSNNTSWLDSGEECNGWGVSCTNTGAVVLDLPSNNLQGTLPPEIGLLTSLCECVSWKKAYPPACDSNGLLGLFAQFGSLFGTIPWLDKSQLRLDC
jgi:hypothetical protein